MRGAVGQIPPAKKSTPFDVNTPDCRLNLQQLRKLQEDILARYSIPGNFSQLADREAPIGWVDPKTEPVRALAVGIPRKLIRQEQKVVIPIFLLPQTFYFHGDSEVISALNTATGYWISGKNEEALKLYDALALQVKAMDKSDPERAIVYLMRGYLSLDFYVRALFGLYKSENPVSYWKIRARFDFFQGIGEPNISSYLSNLSSKMPENFNNELYLKSLESAVFTDEDMEKPIKPPAVKRSGLTIYPIVWLRTLAPTALFNLMVLSRVEGQFAKAFTAAEKLGEYAKTMQDFLKSSEANVLSIISHDSIPSIGKPIYIRPTHLGDLVSLSFLVRAAASLKSKDPVQALIFADETIRSSHSKALAAVGFSIIGNVYYDLRNDLWARRTFAWAEAMEPQLVESFPDSILWASEASLWRGDFTRAFLGFSKLRKLLSDRKFGPFVELRLLQLELLMGKEKEAMIRTEYLFSHYRNTEIMPDVAVIDFCRNSKILPSRAREVAYGKVMAFVKDAGNGLREQARACLVASDLDEARQRSSVRSQQSSQAQSTKWSVTHKESGEQLALIEGFRKEFPTSPYLELFKEQAKLLGLSSVFSELENNNCSQVLDFYLSHSAELWALAPDLKNQKSTATQKSGVSTLLWTKDEMQKTVRCAAFLGKNKIWQDIRKSGEPDDQRIHDALFEHRTLPSETSLIRLRDSLVAADGWRIFDKEIEKVDQVTTALLDDDKFWKILGIGDVLAAEGGVVSADPFYDAPFETALQNKDLSLNTQVCSWANKAIQISNGIAGGKKSASDSEKRILELRLSKLAQVSWLDALLESNAQKETKCLHWISRQVVQKSAAAPEQLTDRLFLWPLIDRTGPLLEPEIAMSLARRTFDREGKLSEEVLGVFEGIADRSQNSVLSQAAKSWLRKNQAKQKNEVW